jgi:hypothetical protein
MVLRLADGDMFGSAKPHGGSLVFQPAGAARRSSISVWPRTVGERRKGVKADVTTAASRTLLLAVSTETARGKGSRRVGKEVMQQR